MGNKNLKRAVIAVPKEENEASEFIGHIGSLMRKIESIQADLEEKEKNLKLAAVDRIDPLNQEIDNLIDGLFVFAEANRERLTEGKTKTVKLATGTISWRMTPSKVNITNTEKILVLLKRMKLDRLIRTKEEPDKEAMLREPDVARGVRGITITQHEEFVVKPDIWDAEIVSRADKLSKAVA